MFRTAALASTPPASGPISMRSRPRTSNLVPDDRQPRGLLDTSVIIDLDQLEPDVLPLEVAVSALTMAELAAGPHATTDPVERARRQDRLQRAEAAFDPLPFDGEASRADGRIYAVWAPPGAKRAESCRRFAHRGNRMRRRTPALHV